MALVEVPAKGKAHLIPVAIMVDGKFYDASAYKASPVPMALEYGTVYEAFKTGVSQGFVTISGVLQGKGAWRGEGKWQSQAEIQAAAQTAAAKKTSAKLRKPSEDTDSRPVLRRSSPDAAATPDSSTPTPSPTAKNPGGSSEDKQPPSPQQASADPHTASEKKDATGDSSKEAASKEDQEPADPNRPALRRGIPKATKEEKPGIAPDSKASPGSKSVAKSSPESQSPDTTISKNRATIQVFTAISDASGPEPHSYVYELKPDEEAKFRKKMLAMVAEEVKTHARQLTATMSPSPSHALTKGSKPAKEPLPDFENIDFRVFDISSGNEPLMVLTAQTKFPPTKSNDTANSTSQYMVTLVARDDIYGELHKAFSNVTDTLHLDVVPRFEIIDAVDADGDARAELLFRQVSDSGSAFAIYRVIGNQLWPLFQGTPGQ